MKDTPFCSNGGKKSSEFGLDASVMKDFPLIYRCSLINLHLNIFIKIVVVSFPTP